MGISRMYTGDDGETHVEDLTLESNPELTTLLATEGVELSFVEEAIEKCHECITVAAFVITLSGEVEIGLADGTVHRYGPGHVNLAEDVTGKGHTTRVVGDVPRVTATVRLAD